MAIRLSKYLKLVTDEETSERSLKYRCGYQTMHPNTDKYTLLNMASIEASWKAGTLRDINGDACVKGDGKTPIITMYASLSEVIPASELETADVLTDVNGGQVEAAAPVRPSVPTASAVPAFAAVA